MLAKLLPVIFLLLGTGGGIGAGLFLAPGSMSQKESGEMTEEEDAQGSGAQSNAPMMEPDGNENDALDTEFVEMSNQFVIPVVKNDAIFALVIVTLSLETRVGLSEEIYAREPKLRDAFLRVLFDHANMGGFDGAFTSAEILGLLRSALRDVAHKVISQDIVDVLIVDIIRQDT